MASLSKISLHHVGGRWGNNAFPLLQQFKCDFVNVLYEADEDAIPGIYETRNDQKSELIVLPYSLFDSDSDAPLNLYLNPGLTSLRRFGGALAKRYSHLFGIDFDFGDAGARLVKQRTIQTRSLDSVLASRADTCPPPDFLSLDVQGAEYEIIVGATDTLRHSVCGVIAEVEFAEMYVGQKRFQDVHDLLSTLGFEFVRFLSIGETSGPTAPIGFRSSGYQTWADALFLRRPDSISITNENRREMLCKLAFFAIVFGNIELAVHCADLLGQSALRHARSSMDLPVYVQFVDEFSHAYERASRIWPPVFSQILSPDRFLDFSRAASPDRWPAIFDGLQRFDDDYVRALEALQAKEDTEVEALLRRYGLTAQADRLKEVRCHQAHSIYQNLIAARRAL